MRFFKKFVSLVLCVAMLLSVNAVPTLASTDFTIAVEVPQTALKKGDSFEVPITLANNLGVAGLGFTVSIDSTRLEWNTGGKTYNISDTTSYPFIDGRLGSFDALTPPNTLSNKFWFYSTANNSSNGTVLTLKLNVKSDAPVGEATVTITAVANDIYDQSETNVPFALDNSRKAKVSESISAVDVAITAPVMGAVPQTSVSGTGFTGTVTWNGNPATFLPSTIYTASVTVDASQFYQFADTAPITVSGATISNVTRTGTSSIAFDAIFPATTNKTDVSSTITFNDVAATYDKTPKSLISATSTDSSGGWFTYVDANTGQSIDLSQTLAGTYSVKAIYDSTTAHGEKVATLTINKATLTVTGATATPRDYNKTTAITISGSTLDGIVPSDTVTIAEISGTISNADAGVNKPVTVSVTIDGADKDNYTVTPPAGLTVTISTASPTYTVPGTSTVKFGSPLTIFHSVAPNNGTGIDSEEVSGTVVWYSDAGYSTTALESDVTGLAIAATKTLYWKFTPANANYATKQGSTVFTIVDGDPQPITFPNQTVNKTYGDDNFTVTASGATGTVTYSSSDTTVATVNASTGEVTIVGAGNTIITAAAAMVPGVWAESSTTYNLVVGKKTPALSDLAFTIPTEHSYTGVGQGIGSVTSSRTGFGVVSIKYNNSTTAPINAKTYAVTADIAEGVNYSAAVLTLGNYTINKANLTPSGAIVSAKTYDGTTTADVTDITFTGLQNSEALVLDTDYTISDTAFNAATVADANSVNGNVALMSTAKANNYVLSADTFAQTATIGKATLTNVPTANVYVNPNVARTFTLSKILSISSGWTYIVDADAATEITITEAVSTNVDVTLVNANYNDATATISVTVTDKEIVAEITPPLTLDKAYDGEEVVYNGDWTSVFTPANPKNAGDYTLELTRAEDSGHVYEPVTISFTISKAELTVTADDKEINRGAALPLYTFTTSPAALYVSDTWTTAPIANSPTANAGAAGTYAIIVTPGVLSAPNNYNVTYENGILTVIASSDVTLATLSLGASVTLTPTFTAGTKNYTASVPNSTSSVIVTATVNDVGATISGTGTKSLNVGSNEIKVIVTAADGTTSETYTITVTRASSSSSGGGGSWSGGSWSGGSSPSTSATISTKEVEFDTTAPKDVSFTLSRGSYTLRNIKNGSYNLVFDRDYTVNGNTYTIKSEYLATLKTGTTTLVLDMSGGTDPSLVITIAGDKPLVSDDIIRVNGKETTLKLNADGSITIAAADVEGLPTPIILTLPFEESSNTHVGVIKKDGQNIIIPFSRKGSMIMLISEPGTYGVINNKKNFIDISGHWAADTIDFITAREIYSGVGDNKFDPNGGMTRAMFAQVLANIERADLTAYRASRFTDVENSAWYAAAVEWAADKGIVSGYGGSLFGPNDLITREQMAVMLNNYMRDKGIVLKKDDDYIPFADDSSISSWAKEAVTDMKRYGLIAGVGDNRYAPLDTANRASVAQVFKNFIETYIK